MELIILCTTTFIAAGLTLLSGFGLGTLLLPVFVIFFPVDLAISMTAVVHFFNNILKLMLLGSHADTSVVVRFGVPAILAAFVGAWVLTRVSGLSSLMRYDLFGSEFEITPVKVTIGALLIMFTLFEMVGKDRSVVWKSSTFLCAAS